MKRLFQGERRVDVEHLDRFIKLVRSTLDMAMEEEPKEFVEKGAEVYAKA